ncbi:hypothetical protein [Dentiradicibacter hellwigii]|uniref:Uncharacterized protein n=1 Tax=Dentiradicibacter hellwigii TaxID=3149053 RepID=A0ABV4UE85_9RHOO
MSPFIIIQKFSGKRRKTHATTSGRKQPATEPEIKNIRNPKIRAIASALQPEGAAKPPPKCAPSASCNGIEIPGSKKFPKASRARYSSEKNETFAKPGRNLF